LSYDDQSQVHNSFYSEKKRKKNSLFFKQKNKKKEEKRTYEMYADDIFRIKVQPTQPSVFFQSRKIQAQCVLMFLQRTKEKKKTE
jgi:hypothetical protein